MLERKFKTTAFHLLLRTHMNMLGMQWINLVLLAGLISYSYGNHQRRRTREAYLKKDGEALIKEVFKKHAETTAQIKAALGKEEEDIRKTTQKIFLAVEKIAKASVQDVAHMEHWASIKREISDGINMVIGAYQRFNELHRETCQSIENFTNVMIKKYQIELTALGKLNLPDIPNGNLGSNSSLYKDFITQLWNLLMYAKTHEKTLETAHRAIADITQAALARRMADATEQSHTIVIDLSIPDGDLFSSQTFDISCGGVSEDHGHPQCPLSAAQVTGEALEKACTCFL